MIKLLLLSLFIYTLNASNINSNDLNVKANQEFKKGNKEAAKYLYEKSAKLGNAEANYQLTYRFVIEENESIERLKNAAKKGHSRALDAFLNTSKLKTSPKEKLAIYRKAKKINPNMRLFGEEELIKTLEMASEAPEFNLENFLSKYDLTVDEYSMFPIWEMAEETSKNARFGKANPLLTFQLIILGGRSASSYESAIEWAYNNWKNSTHKVFNICEYGTSNYAFLYCADRDSEESEKGRKTEIQTIEEKLSKVQIKHFKEVLQKAEIFFTSRAESEGINGGGSYSGRVLYSIDKQMDEYIELIKKTIVSQRFPKTQVTLKTPQQTFKYYDDKLNINYKNLVKLLNSKTFYNDYLNIQKLKDTQRAWIKYRDIGTKFLLNFIEDDNYNLKAWFTEKRNEQLEIIKEKL